MSKFERKVYKMTNSFCRCDYCNAEVESLFLWRNEDYVGLFGERKKRLYKCLEGFAYCENCNKVLTDAETHWEDVE